MSWGDIIALGALSLSVLVTGGGTAWKLLSAFGSFRDEVRDRLLVLELRLDGLDKEAAQEQVSRAKVYKFRGSYYGVRSPRP